MLKPATRFLTNTLDEQFLHIRREMEECRDAKIDYMQNQTKENLDHFNEELADLQQACETMMAINGLNWFQRTWARLKVIYKNWKRNYYKKVVSENGNQP